MNTMNPVHAARRPAFRRRGAAMIETAMCIPLFACILVGTMFLGWAMMDQQQVKTAARYVSWRHANSGAWTYDFVDPNTDSEDAEWFDDPDHPGLNHMFFRDEAIGVSVSRSGGQNDEVEDLVDAAAGRSDYAGEFADKLLVNPYPDHGAFPRAQGASVSAEFGTDVAAFKRYKGAISAYHIRDGVEWRKNEAGCRYVTRKQFLDDLDQVLLSVPNPGTEMGKMIRDTYVNGW
jgi:hypothetical protein